MKDFINVKVLEGKFQVTLPERYRRFIEEHECDKFSGWHADLPSYKSPMPVYFAGKDLESFINEDWPEDDPTYGHPSATMNVFENNPGFVPLATIGREEEQFLAAEVEDPKCPVRMWEHETGQFVPVSESLDRFLKSLKKA